MEEYKKLLYRGLFMFSVMLLITLALEILFKMTC